MHKELKRFHIESEISDDSQFIKQRDTQEHMLLQMMRDSGYIPVLDLGPFWSTKLNEKARYDAVLSIYGIYVGKRKACTLAGVDGTGKYYPISTPSDK
jgi:hypothetical protein